MSRISLSAVINESFVNRFSGAAAKQASKTSSNKLGGSDAVSVYSSLRTGARAFGTAVQSLNSAISFVNTSEDRLKTLSRITDRLVGVAKAASEPGAGDQERGRLNVEFKKLTKQFQDIVTNAQLGDFDLLDKDGITAVLTNVGLDPKNVEDLGLLFDRLKVVPGETLIADSSIQGDGPTPIPTSAALSGVRSSTEQLSIFDSSSTVATRGGAYEVLHDLGALSEQLKKNVKVLSDTRDILAQNVQLARATGLAFLDLSETATEDTNATDLARDLRQRIQKNASGALSQAANLNYLTVAALVLDQSRTT